jgi:hypothetical protein
LALWADASILFLFRLGLEKLAGLPLSFDLFYF